MSTIPHLCTAYPCQPSLTPPVRRENKAVQLGSGRSAKALHTRWLRDQGRIVDRPRVALTTSNANVGEVAAMETLMLLAKLGR